MEEQETTLIQLAERLRQCFAPVEPSLAFVRSLKVELVEAARRRQEHTGRLRRGLLVGAFILGSVASVAGVTTVLLLRRRARAHPPVALG